MMSLIEIKLQRRKQRIRSAIGAAIGLFLSTSTSVVAQPVPNNACELILINSGFEDPIVNVPPPNPVQVFDNGLIANFRENDVPGWSTTAFDGLIELWRDGNFFGVPVLEGQQFAEINANGVGILFQDAVTVPGSVLTWQFAHRGRGGVDTLNLRLGPPGATVAQINPATNNTQFQTGNTEWVVYQGTYTVPAGQTTTRFEYVALATGSGDQTAGNFLDAIRFGFLCDHGDADASYPVLRANGGAAHVNDNVTFLGNTVAVELEGQPSVAANGDDNAPGDDDNTDDEDGVTFTSILEAGSNATVDIVASVAAPLSGWIDFNSDGDWNDPGEQIFTDEPLNPGVNNLTFAVPSGAVVGDTYARFRISPQSGLAPTGIVVGGEVEDYLVTITEPPTILLLVKRITAINGTDLTGFVNDGVADSADDNANWPTPLTDFLRGAINGGQVQPGDEVEYTVYFLSAGGQPARNVKICDVIPANTNFVADGFGTNSGIALANSSTAPPTAPTDLFTNIVNDGDRGDFYPVFSQTPNVCKDPNNIANPLTSSNNVNGAVVVNVVRELDGTSLPGATAAGTPANSYGFIRFKVRVQ